MRVTVTCPCGAGRSYAQCCGTLHAGVAAANAEALMRARYSAYALGLGDYLVRSWHATTRPPDFSLDNEAPQSPAWLGLSIKRFRESGPDAADVEFIARYRVGGGKAVRLHERSRFIREDGHWFYLDGVHL
ncbi:MAG: YchJ family metal-binding protein [Pseudoxanthomonas sp.]